jgi:hypothetical protein
MTMILVAMMMTTISRRNRATIPNKTTLSIISIKHRRLNRRHLIATLIIRLVRMVCKLVSRIVRRRQKEFSNSHPSVVGEHDDDDSSEWGVFLLRVLPEQSS